MGWEEDLMDFSIDFDDVEPDNGRRARTGLSKKAIETTKSTTTQHPLHSVFPRDSKIGQVIAWWAAGVYVYKTGKKTYQWFDERANQGRKDKYSISIDSYEEDDLYNIVFQWIISNVDDNDPIFDYDLITLYRRPKHLVFRTSSTATSFSMTLEGIDVQVSLDEQESRDGNLTSFRKSMVIRCKNQAEVDLLTAKITSLYDDTMYEKTKDITESGRKTYPYAMWTGVQWNYKNTISRDKDSVVLRGNDRETLFKDIERFRDLKSEYLRTNIPWHRGYLFHGPPGTGKTSLALAVASQYDAPTYFLSLSMVKGDTALMNAISGMESDESVLILEDIDVITATHSRDSEGSKRYNEDHPSVTLQGLLDALDGVNTPSGLITIMTTNHLERLDPALVRPGRIDLKLNIGYLDDDQLRRLVLWYIGRDVDDLPTITANITPAQITGVIKDNMGYPDICVAEIRKFIHECNNANTI